MVYIICQGPAGSGPGQLWDLRGRSPGPQPPVQPPPCGRCLALIPTSHPTQCARPSAPLNSHTPRVSRSASLLFLLLPTDPLLLFPRPGLSNPHGPRPRVPATVSQAELRAWHSALRAEVIERLVRQVGVGWQKEWRRNCRMQGSWMRDTVAYW